MNSIKSFGTIVIFLFFCFLFIVPFTAKAQVTNTYVPRPVGVFQSGQERECELHWLNDLNVLREWQSEYHYWRARYNTYAEILGFGNELDTGHPTLNEYPVPKDLIQQDFDAGLYPSLIAACNTHVAAAHETEDQFAFVTWLMRLYTCHARATTFGRFCDSSFDEQFPLEFIDRLK